MQSLKEQNSKSSIPSDFFFSLAAVIHSEIVDLKLVKWVINEAFRNSTRFDLLIRNCWKIVSSRVEVPPVLNLLNFRPWVFCNDFQQSNVLELSCYCTQRTPQIHNHIRKTWVLFFLQFATEKCLHLHKSTVYCCSGPAQKVDSVPVSHSCNDKSPVWVGVPSPQGWSTTAETGGACVEFNWASSGAAHTDLKRTYWFDWLNLFMHKPQN